MKKIFVILLCLVSPLGLRAAAPIFHATVAQMWLDHFEEYTEEEKRAFMLGTLFPDIRYIAKISRSKTHEKGLTIKDLLQIKDPFTKGMKLHSFVDEVRNNYVDAHFLPHEYRHLAYAPQTHIKVLEDEVLYFQNKCDKKAIGAFLTHSLKEEESFGITAQVVQEWHEQLSECFLHPPSENYLKLKERGKGHGALSVGTIKTITKNLDKYKNDPVIISHTNGAIAQFEHLFSEYKKNAASLKN